MSVPIPHAAAAALAASAPSRSWNIAPKAVDRAMGEVRTIDRPPFVPNEVWTARETLARIRQVAAVRRKSPDALLGVVLARLGAQDYRLKLPPNGGEPVGLGFYAALVGPSGAGKSAAMRTAEHVVPKVDGVVEVNTGTGEGLREAFFGEVEVDGGKERRQTKHGLILNIGESTKLERLAGRKGTTHQDFFLSAWMDEQTGDRNATSGTTRELEPGRYAVSMAVGMQPHRSRWFFDEGEVGLPQRFLWTSAFAPPRTGGDRQWPEDVAWTPLGFLRDSELGRQERLRNEWGGVADWMVLLDVAEPIVREVEETQDAVAEGSLILHELDGHRLMVRLKMAALLARLEYRLDLSVEDWQLSGAILDVSDGVRSWTLDKLADKSADEAAMKGGRAAAAEAAKSEGLEARYLAAGARAIGRKARRVEGAMSRREAMQAPNGEQRHHASFDAMLDRALSDGFIVRDGNKFRPGSVDPR